MELNTNELRLIQPGGKEMREYAENTQGYYAAKGLHGPVPDESEKKILAETCAPEESTEMHFPGVIIAATKDGEVLGHIRLGEPCRARLPCAAVSGKTGHMRPKLLRQWRAKRCAAAV